MKVAIITPQFPCFIQTYVLNHILGLQKVGAEFLILSCASPSKLVQPEVFEHHLLDSTRYLRLQDDRILVKDALGGLMRCIGASGAFQASLRVLLSCNWRKFGFRYFLKEFLKIWSLFDFPFQIVHAHGPVLGYEFLFLREIFSIPLVTTLHGLPVASEQLLGQRKLRYLIETGNIFIVNTRFAKSKWIDYGCPSDKIVVIPQAIDTKKYKFRPREFPKNGKIRLLTVARLAESKGLGYALEGVKRLLRSYPEMEYRIVGDGPLTDQLAEIITREGLGGNVKLVGAKTGKDLVEEFHRAHIFILPSVKSPDSRYEETQGLVIQEAQASGLCVVASRIGGIPECIIDRETGILFDERNVQEIKRAIEYLLENQHKWQSISEKAYELLEKRFSIEVTTKQLIGVYTKLMENSKL